MSDSDRKKILERRERFLRGAAWGAAAGTLLTSCDPSGPVCHSARLNLPKVVAEGIGCAPPRVCLSIAIVDAGGPSTVTVDAGPDDASSDD